MKYIYILFLSILINGSCYADMEHPCKSDAIGKANKLIRLHFGEDDRIKIEKEVHIIHPLKNPVNKNQSFDVLELWGSIYKGNYRMRFIYAQIDGCVLMGQEILEHASL